ncbi:hypothetical protein BSL78_14350 [Apostichopus japonicus]|uniref:Uncharacterized protein n=1 Tax=Stichopus japonicus TaxID=307972 RepID=A0A2G8KL92_STIJA|nr:hypothetical protein BSL78_14350 [Apostichopus japonicus]
MFDIWMCGRCVDDVWTMWWTMCGRCVDDVWTMCGRCVDDAWTMRGRCVDDAWTMRGRCVDDAWTMRGRCVDDAWTMRGRCVDDAWTMRGRCVDDAWTMRGRCVDDAWTMRGRCVDDAWTMRGRCVDDAWTMRGRCVDDAWTMRDDVWTIREGPHEKRNEDTMEYESHEADSKDSETLQTANHLQKSNNTTTGGAYGTTNIGDWGMDDKLWLEDPVRYADNLLFPDGFGRVEKNDAQGLNIYSVKSIGRSEIRTRFQTETETYIVSTSDYTDDDH